MSVKALVKLAGSGNTSGVEDVWLRWLEAEASAEEWKQRADVLAAVAENGNLQAAVALATMAIEAFSDRLEPKKAADAAASFLLVLNKSDELRKPVGDLYLNAYEDVEGIERLIEQAGVYGGRPPRRAIRTLEVALNISPGAFLVHRHDPTAARVEKVDTDNWKINITEDAGPASYDAVTLADNYQPASAEDFRVLRQFQPQRLVELAEDSPAELVIRVLHSHGDRIDSDVLAKILTPDPVAVSDWTKWLTRARQQLRLSPHVLIEGRTPYLFTYNHEPLTFEQEIEQAFAAAADPLAQLAVIDDYLRGCKQRKQEPDPALLNKVRERVISHAQRVEQRSRRVDLVPWLIAHHIGEALGETDAIDCVVERLKLAPDPAAAILAVGSQQFWPAACNAMELAHPANLADALERLLPHAPINVADSLAERLIELGADAAKFEQIAERILRDPLDMSEGMVWLWNGPKPAAAQVSIPAATILTRMLHSLVDLQHRDDLSSERKKEIKANVRDVLKARQFERFKATLEEIELGVASALRTEINRLDDLGRALSEDLQKLLRKKFPNLIVKPRSVPRWQQQDAIYVTAAGKNAKQREIDELANVKIKENAVAIGNAAERGDLSENSEYKFALEERDLLHARLGQAQKEMDMAVVLTPEDVPRDHVGIGCRVSLQHASTGTAQTITILSAWEADSANRVYNYKTPLAQAILGAKLGDTVPVEYFDPPGDYRISAIEPAITAD